MDWAPIGAVQTASGYDVAWKDPGTDKYTVWTTDNNGNYLSSTPALSGTSLTRWKRMSQFSTKTLMATA